MSFLMSVYLYKLVQLHSAVLETIFDFCESKTRMIKNFDIEFLKNRLTTLILSQNCMHIIVLEELSKS